MNASTNRFCAGITKASATTTATAALLSESGSAGGNEQASAEELHERTALKPEVEVDALNGLFVSEFDGFDSFEFGIHMTPPTTLSGSYAAFGVLPIARRMAFVIRG